MSYIHVNAKMDTDTRSRLLDSATELFARQGYDGTSTREIATQANCNISLIGHYFGGKQGLMQAIISDYLDAEEQELRTLLVCAAPAGELVSLFIDFIFDLFLQHEHVMRIIQREMANLENPTADYTRGRIDTNLTLIAELIQRIPNNHTSGISPRALANMLLGMIASCLLDRDSLNDCDSIQRVKGFIKMCFLNNTKG